MNYHYSDGQSNIGEQTLRDIAEKMLASPSSKHLVWAEGMDAWKDASSIPEIKAACDAMLVARQQVAAVQAAARPTQVLPAVTSMTGASTGGAKKNTGLIIGGAAGIVVIIVLLLVLLLRKSDSDTVVPAASATAQETVSSGTTQDVTNGGAAQSGGTQSAPEPRNYEGMSEQAAVKAFVGDLIAAQNGNDMNRLMSFYANEVDYFSWGQVPVARVRRDKEKFMSHWPQRDYRLDPTGEGIAVSVSDMAGVSYVEYVLAYTARNDADNRQTSGRTRVNLTVSTKNANGSLSEGFEVSREQSMNL